MVRPEATPTIKSGPGNGIPENISQFYERGLVVLALVTLTLAIVRVLADTALMLQGRERAAENITISLFGIAAVALLLLRVGPLLRLKWGGAEAEFGSLVAKVQNSTEIATKDLGARIEELQSSIEAKVRPQSNANLLAGRVIPPVVPALSRPIQYPDDKWKGRFGRLSVRDGYTLSATFGERSSKTVEVTLSVTSTEVPAVSRTVEFFLHPSFPRERVKVRLVDGRADLDLLAWGGFTVGVWIAEAGVELELDLSQIRGAPHVIKFN